MCTIISSMAYHGFIPFVAFHASWHFFHLKDSQRRRTVAQYAILELNVRKFRSHSNIELKLGTVKLRIHVRQFFSQFFSHRSVWSFLLNNVCAYVRYEILVTNSVKLFKFLTTSTQLVSIFLSADPNTFRSIQV